MAKKAAINIAHIFGRTVDARSAFDEGAVEKSKAVHSQNLLHSEEAHSSAGGRIKNVVFGGLDGIITTFAVVAGAVGGGLGVEVILILGFSSVLADALSMGVGDTLSTKAENEFIRRERDREEWEMENNPEGEVEEMIELYKQRGVGEQDARLVIETMAKYKDFFVDVMMTEELGLQVPADDDTPALDGLVTGLSFVVFGTVPLLGYAALYSIGLSTMELFLIACALTVITLFALGAFKTRYSNKQWWVGGFEIVIVGSATAATAYFAGWFIESIVLHGHSAVGGLH